MGCSVHLRLQRRKASGRVFRTFTSLLPRDMAENGGQETPSVFCAPPNHPCGQGHQPCFPRGNGGSDTGPRSCWRVTRRDPDRGPPVALSTQPLCSQLPPHPFQGKRANRRRVLWHREGAQLVRSPPCLGRCRWTLTTAGGRPLFTPDPRS